MMEDNNNNNMLEHIKLCQYSGDVGCVIGRKDYLIQLDLPLTTECKISYKIPAREVSNAMELQYAKYMVLVANLHQLASEITKYSVGIQKGVDNLNVEFKDVKFIKPTFSIDQSFIADVIGHFVSLISSHAVLYVRDRDMFDVMCVDLDTVFEYNAVLNTIQISGEVTNKTFMDFGERARDGVSIFRRVVHHYTLLLDTLKETTHE